MTSISLNKQIGSVLVVVGTEIGAGVLALPIIIAQIGLLAGSIVMFISWLLMTYTALLVCETTLASVDGVSFAGIGRNLLNPFGQMVIWGSFLFLLYAIIVAYISGAVSAFSTELKINSHIISILFVFVLGTCVVLGTSVVDWVNRLLLGAKLIALISVGFVLLSHIKPANLTYSFFTMRSFIGSIPVFITAFTSHLIIPPLRTYLKSDTKILVRTVLIGSIIPLILYIIWIIGVMGIIPHTGINSFYSLFNQSRNPNVGDVLNLMNFNIHSSFIYLPVSIFSNISVTTSFLGVSLALFYFLIDAFKLHRLSKFKKNLAASILTFVLPLIVVWHAPDIFIKALGYVGLCCSILLIIIPFFMMQNLNKKNHSFKIKFINHPFLLWLSLILGVVVVVIQLSISYIK